MHRKNNVEIYHDGWLVKSPPNPRGIFKARWRRRWFTLKQGELPGQFFLEYYTDISCRKRKGIIDLDQVEQVDAGLSLDRSSIKYQFMFDMKTPNRTYYLAAETEEDMRNWVMVICQVCNLQETEEKTNVVNESSSTPAQYYNLGPNADFEAKEITQNDYSTNTTETSLLTNSASTVDNSIVSSRFEQLSVVNEYENDNVLAQIHQNINNNHETGLNYTNLPPLNDQRPLPAQRPSKILQPTKSTGAIKKIPENLKLRSADDKINNNHNDYRASGPYIPLSDCFSGSPVLFKNEGDPKTPLNSLDPKFYDNPRSHIKNMDFNLTGDQPNSPKRTNIQQMTPPTRKHLIGKQSINSSPTDSEGGSTDEEWNVPKAGSRMTRPSETSSIEDEKIAITAGQSYVRTVDNPIPLPPKRISLILDKKPESSDTEENVSPIGPKECTSSVELSYDFPRSYNVQHPFSSQRDIGSLNLIGMQPGNLVTSTPNLIHSATLDRNFYGNAAPREPHVFRFDAESLAMPPPEVNRTLKPRNGIKPNPTVQPPVDRTLKPSLMKKSQVIGTGSIKRKGPENLKIAEVDSSVVLNESIASNQSPKTPNDRLQYLDLDHTSSPQKSMMGSIAAMSIASNMQSLDGSFSGSCKEGPGVAYTTVDFLKTDAFNRVREDSEVARASKSRMKN